jgi:hypothetical protein
MRQAGEAGTKVEACFYFAENPAHFASNFTRN